MLRRFLLDSTIVRPRPMCIGAEFWDRPLVSFVSPAKMSTLLEHPQAVNDNSFRLLYCSALMTGYVYRRFNCIIQTCVRQREHALLTIATTFQTRRGCVARVQMPYWEAAGR